MYKQLKDNRGNMMEFVLRTGDNTYIPFASDNTDYQQYLEWLSEGNTPEPADEGS